MEKLIDREDLLTEMNRPFGHTEGDRADNIPLLLVQMEKDIGRIITAYESTINRISLLKGITNILGIKSCLTQLEISTKGLACMQNECNNILLLTKNKKYSKDVENRFSVAEKQKRKMEEARKVGMINIKGGSATIQSHKGIKEIDYVKEIIARQNQIQKSIQTNTSAREVTPIKITQKRTSRQVYDHGATITLRKNKKVQIPAPEHDSKRILYTIRELCEHLQPYDGQGLKRVIEELKRSGRCLVSSTTFLTHLKKYKDEKILPLISDYGGINGRKPILDTEEAPQALNSTIHENKSYTENGIESTKTILIETKKRKADEMGIFEHTSEPSRYTKRVYDRLATILDPNCSKTRDESSRLKSENREIMSRSTRTCFTSAVSCIASSFKKGTMKRQEYESLSSGCKTAIDIARQNYGGDVVPIKIHNSINSDDLGRFITEGIPVQSSVRKKSMKTSKSSTARATRKTSSLWRKATDEDNYSPGIKVKFKSLVSASGHTAPICIHFYGLTDAEINLRIK